MKQNTPVKCGIIGTNFISDWFVDAVRRANGVECAAVYSRTEENGSRFAEAHGIGRVYTDFDAFLSSDIDAVYIASPHVCHMRQAAMAMRHKKHVLVEKAAALNERQFLDMCRIADENGVILLEAMRPVFDPALDVIRRVLPKLGAVHMVTLDFCQYSSRYDRFRAGEQLNAFNPALSNAAILDMGIYCAAVCAALFGEPTAVRGASVFLGNGMEGSGCMTALYPDMLCVMRYAKTFSSVGANCIAGEQGTLQFSAVSKPRDFKIIYRDGTTEEIPFAPSENNMEYEVAAFCNCVRNGSGEKPYRELTAQTLRITDAARQSAGLVLPDDGATV